MYDAISEQIIKDTGIISGKCLDIGGGNGKLCEFLCLKTDLISYVLDINSFQLNHAKEHYNNIKFRDRIIPVFGSAEDIPFDNDSMDLIISRGSCMFWDNPETAVKEMLRVLKPGGIAYFGGGIGQNLNDSQFEIIKNEIYKPMMESEKKKDKTPFIMLKSIYSTEFINT